MYVLRIFIKKQNGEYILINYELYKDFIKLFTDIICQYDDIYGYTDDDKIQTIPELHDALKMAVSCEGLTGEGIADPIHIYVGDYKFTVDVITEDCYEDQNFIKHIKRYPGFKK